MCSWQLDIFVAFKRNYVAQFQIKSNQIYLTTQKSKINKQMKMKK